MLEQFTSLGAKLVNILQNIKTITSGQFFFSIGQIICISSHCHLLRTHYILVFERGKMVKKTDTPAKFILGPPVAY